MNIIQYREHAGFECGLRTNRVTVLCEEEGGRYSLSKLGGSTLTSRKMRVSWTNSTTGLHLSECTQTHYSFLMKYLFFYGQNLDLISSRELLWSPLMKQHLEVEIWPYDRGHQTS